MRIEYLDGERLRRSLVAGCDAVQERRVELNRINVFPVPDGDTGTNLALTASAISERLRRSDADAVHVVAREAADAAILGARGNCGMILSHFLLGFADSVEPRAQLDVDEFGVSLTAAVNHVYSSLEKPIEGTIITVMREVAEEASANRTRDFRELVDRLVTRARDALARTPDLLPALRKAGVVDAGAKGFVFIMEGVAAALRGDPILPLEEPADFGDTTPAAAAVEYPAENERYRFCTEGLVRGADLPTSDTVREALRGRGDSLIVLVSSDILKVHIHTDDPEDVFDYLRTLGELATHKAEDMAVQHAAVERAAAAHIQLARRPISLLADSACNLPAEVVRAHGIHVVPMSIVVEDGVLRDGIDITPEQFVARLEAGEQPTTSQPAPAAFLEGYRRAAEDGERVLGVIVARVLSGTLASAEAAAKQIPTADIELFDSRTAALAQGMLLLKAAELAEAGQELEQIVPELDRIRGQSGLMFTIDVYDNLLASGRVSRGRVMVAGLLDIKPILGLDDEGRVQPLARVRGTERVLGRMLDLIEERAPRDARKLRFGLMHVGRPAIIDELRREIGKRWGRRDILVAPVTPVIATHLGPRAWGVAWQLEDE